MSARVRLKLDDDFSQISDSMLRLVHPLAADPMPSCTVVRFDLDSDWAKDGEGLPIGRNTLLQTKSVDGVRCRFRTCLPLTLWPVRVDALEAVALGAREPGVPPNAHGALRIRLKTFGGRPFSSVGLDELTFFIDRDPVVVHRLYELTFADQKGVLVRAPSPSGGEAPAPVRLGPEHIHPVGFAPEEALVPDREGAAQGHRLLLEYFSFPDKFHFFRIDGLKSALSRIQGDTAELMILLKEYPIDLQGKLEAKNLLLGCAPAVNLFEHEADPIRLTPADVEFRVTPDARHEDSYEVHSVLDVSSVAPRTGKTRQYEPFYGLRHGSGGPDKAAFWNAERRSGGRKQDAGSELWITLVDKGFQPDSQEPGEVLNVRVLCSNSDLPSRLSLGTGATDELRVEGKPGVAGIRCLRKPTASIRPQLGSEGRWKVVSHLSLNFLSIVDADADHGDRSDLSGISSGSTALDAFRELLKLYDFTDSAVSRQRIAGLIGVQSRTVLRRIRNQGMSFHARGLEVRLRFDESAFVGTGVFLFASVLERFLAHYTSINSFVQTVAEVRQREGVMKVWPPRAGAKQLL
ncbi:MAG: type VI secretion system protein [Gemmatimonadota bacterium]|nr:MAG: type VI secretion system protein [Gemmatimonadota bacterium]